MELPVVGWLRAKVDFTQPRERKRGKSYTLTFLSALAQQDLILQKTTILAQEKLGGGDRQKPTNVSTSINEAIHGHPTRKNK